MPGIFINYRRDLNPDFAARLYDHLSDRFGHQRTFMDVDSIGLGEDFIDVLERTLKDTAVLLVLIGHNWLTCTDKRGAIRIHHPDDFVRLEVATALKQKGVRVIPVLINDAPLPSSEELPDDLKPLVRRQAIEINSRKFKTDVIGLVEQLQRMLPPEAETSLDAAAWVKDRPKETVPLPDSPEAQKTREREDLARQVEEKRRAREEAEIAAAAELSRKTAARRAEDERLAREAAERAEAKRLARAAAKKAETERVAREAAEKAEADRLAHEAAKKAEAERVAHEAAKKAEAERMAREAARKAESERLALEAEKKAEAERIARAAARKEEADRLAREAARRAEIDRIARETARKAEADRLAREAAEKAEADRLALEAAKKAEAERAALEAARKAEAHRLAYEAAVRAAAAREAAQKVAAERDLNAYIYAVATPHPAADPNRAVRLNLEYQQARKAWEALPRWQRFRTPKPEPPTGI